MILFVPVIGMAIGAGTAALAAKLTDTGISNDFVKELRGSVQPGRVYLAVMVSHVNPEKALDEMKRWAGMAEVVSTNLSPEGLSALESALDQVDVTHGVSEDDSKIEA